jgi:hypothetical protein
MQQWRGPGHVNQAHHEALCLAERPQQACQIDGTPAKACNTYTGGFLKFEFWPWARPSGSSQSAQLRLAPQQACQTGGTPTNRAVKYSKAGWIVVRYHLAYIHQAHHKALCFAFNFKRLARLAQRLQQSMQQGGKLDATMAWPWARPSGSSQSAQLR